MMKKKKHRLIAAFLTALMICTVLSGCRSETEADWEDTLPSAVTKATTDTVQVITEDTNPPISIEMPETTTTVSTEKSTELATSISTEPDEYEETSMRGSVAGVSEVPVSEFTSTSPSSVSSVTTAAPTSVYTASTTAGESSISEASSEISSSAEEVSGTLSLSKNSESSSDKPYIFNDPISRPYCYSTLNTTQRNLYDLIIKAIQKHETKITFPESMTVTADDYCKVYQMIYSNEYSVYYIDTQMKYTNNVRTKTLVSAVLCYTYTQDEINTMQKKIDAATDKIIGQITEEMTEYEIIKLFFDSLVSGCVYDESGANCRDIYGCLVDGKAVCGGYAKAFSYLCDKVGIQSLTITGDAEEIPHMWNMVKIGGEWYHIDVTSGFVKNAATPYIRYDYFCVDDETISKTRTVYEQEYSYPAATAKKYDYYNYYGLSADSMENARKLLEECVINATSKGETTIQFRCTSDEVFDEVVNKFFNQSEALTILDNVYSKCKNKYNRESIVYNQDRSTRVIKFFLSYLD